MLVTTTNQSESVPSVEWKIPEKQTIVATVDSPLGREATIAMSDDSEPSFRERVEEIREERASDEQSSSPENKPAQDDGDQSFREQVEEIRRERESGERGDFQEETPPQVQWGIVAGAFLGGGILGAVANPAQPVSGFFVIGFIIGGVAWAFATESGKTFRKEFMENMDEMQQQQQQTSSSSEPKVVCSNCGWRNPKSNNYCHDCGERLET